MQKGVDVMENTAQTADPFYSESNIRYLNKVIDGIENGTRPLTEHDLIEVEEESS